MNIKAQILSEILTPQQMLELEKRLRCIVDISLEEFLSEFICTKSKTASVSYLKRSIYPTVKKLILEFSKEKPASNISTKDAEDFILEIFNKSPHSARLIHRVCRAIWNWGIRREHILKNVFTNIKLPRHQKGETITIPDIHFSLILENVPAKLKDIYIVLRFTGMRISELLSLRWGSVQLRNKLILVGSKSYITKSRRIRYVPMSKTVDEIFIKKHRTNFGKDRLVFCKTNGFPYQVDYISKKFKNACKKLKLPGSYHLHCLRATLGSELISKGVPIYTVSKLLGHSSVKVTEEHYLGLTIDDVKQAMSKI
ncbi:MAG: integrase [Ignavibacteria bacterium]|nr:integrase [Ignavibacteria bacterium]